MKIFIPKLRCHFRLNSESHLKLLSDKNNARFLHELKLLPGCLRLAAWLKDNNISTIEVKLQKDSLLTLDKINFNKKNNKDEFHFSYYEEAKNKVHKFTIELSQLNDTFDVRYA